MEEVTKLLQQLRHGDGQAADKLLEAVYEELRRIAASKMSNEREGHTLQPTALVHEAWLRLVQQGNLRFDGRAHFFSVAAEAMRRILIEAVRRKRSLKRGGGAPNIELHESAIVQEDRSDEMLAVDEALDLLARKDPAAAELVKRRYFVGMSMEEAAESMGLPLRSAERIWTYAKAWLRQTIA
jgi:RNA polymerase sigma factor (TIGR02999 family)